jgi:N6-adenosine-specific RNA methylase IME4|tara:strand:+ start:46 stop:582 length:537 start_codon:yes stop_codon:yes gene_type:complete
MIKFPKKTFKIIYCDPAWKFKTWSKKGNKKSPKYDLMEIEDIKKLPVNKIADKNCFLFIWVTYPLLQEGLDTIKAWGFNYRTCAFSWIKKNKKAETLFMGLGYYTRSNSEICLLATKGKPKRVSNNVRQVVIDRIREHSRKPDCVRNKIVELCGDLSRIELFARQKGFKGWEAWGNEI